jgi:LPS-assembly protein
MTGSLLFLFFFLVSFAPALADEPVDISADHMEYISSTSTYLAKGSVVIIFEDSSLKADEMRYNSVTSEAIATGNVVYEDPEAVIEADKMEMNLKTKVGTVYNSNIFYKTQNYHLHSGRIDKTGEKTYFLDKATVTTCDSEPPEWKITGSDVHVTQDENLTAKKAKLYLGKYPVLYAPQFWAPLKKGRQTGFLFPVFGYSSTRGHYYKQGFFWAIKENQDAAFYLDYYSEKDFAQGIDYRYIISPETYGELWLYHARDSDPSRELYEVKSYHNHSFSHDVAGYLKIHSVSEFDYYDVMDSTSEGRFGLDAWEEDLFGFAAKERFQKYVESDLHLYKKFSGGRAYVLAQARQSLEGSSSAIVQSLPEMSFIMNTRSKGPFSFNAKASGSHFWRDDGQKGTRLDVNPNFFVSYGRLVNLSQKVGLRETAYFLDSPSLSKNREVFDFVTALSTRLFKRYASFVHTIEPSIDYQYIPPVDNDDISFFDEVDLIDHTSRINYSLTSRVSGIGAYRLESRFRLSQSYDLLDNDEPFAPVLAEASLSSNHLSFDVTASYAIYDKVITETIASTRYTGTKGYIGAEKNFRRATELDQVVFEAGIFRPIKIVGQSFPVDFEGKIWYDLNGNGVQGVRLKSIYTHQCWGISLSYNYTPEEYQIVFAFELKGLGELKLGNI